MSNAEEVCRIAEDFHMESKGANEGASVVSLSEKVPFVRSLRQTPAKLETNRVVLSESPLRHTIRLG